MIIQKNISDLPFEFKTIECPICLHSSLKKIGLRGGKYQRFNLGIETTIVKCMKCSLYFPNPFPFPNNTSDLYSKEKDFFLEKTWEIRKNKMKPLVLKFIKKINLSKIDEPISILDVGAGRGEFIAACNEFKNLNALGIEVSDNFIESAKKKNVKLYKKQLSDLIKENKTFFGVCLQGVIEHTHDPDKIIKEISLLIKKDGVLYVDCPREPNLLSIIGNFYNRITFNKGVYNLQPTWPPYHVFGFNPKSLNILFKKYGFEIEEKLFWANPYVKPKKEFTSKIICMIATQINKLANILGLASNMCFWVIKKN